MGETQEDQTFTIKYMFRFDEKTRKEFEVTIDSKTLALVDKPKKAYPEWTKLSCHKCPNCTLNDADHEYCPIAKSIVDVINFFSTHLAHNEVSIIIITPERNYAQQEALARGVASLIGIYMVTSGCPRMDKLRPMVRFHLPFATELETKYRATSMYLFAQHFLAAKGKDPDWDMKKLGEIYKEINTVNMHFCKRLAEIKGKDAALKAVANLDCFAYSIQFSLDENVFADIEPLFGTYLEEA